MLGTIRIKLRQDMIVPVHNTVRMHINLPRWIWIGIGVLVIPDLIVN